MLVPLYIRIEEDLHKKLKQVAENERRSMASLAQVLVGFDAKPPSCIRVEEAAMRQRAVLERLAVVPRLLAFLGEYCLEVFWRLKPRTRHRKQVVEKWFDTGRDGIVGDQERQALLVKSLHVGVLPLAAVLLLQ